MPPLGLVQNINFHGPSGGGGFVPVLTGLTTDLACSYSAARQTAPGYAGALIRVYNTTTAVQTDIEQVDGYLDETALLSARASGQKLVIHTFYNQFGAGANLVAVDLTKALMIVDASGNIQRLGRLPCGITEADSTGLYVATLQTAHTGTAASGYMVGSYPNTSGIFGSYTYGAANTGTVTFNNTQSAQFFYRIEKGLTACMNRNNTVPTVRDDKSLWADERVVAVSRFTGSEMRCDTGYAVNSASSSGSFNFNKLVVGGVYDEVHNTQSGVRFSELALWTSDIGATAGRQVQSNASGAYAALNTKWNGKKIAWVGTSMPVTVTDDSNLNPYPQRLADTLGAWIVNQGSGGSRIIYDPISEFGLSATIAEQTANGFSAYAKESYEIKILGGVGNLDFLVIDHGCNDAGRTIGAITSTNKQEFCGALNFIRNQTLVAYPSCQIICLTPISDLMFSGSLESEINAIAQAMRDWADQYANVRVIDALSDLSWDSGDATLYIGDGTHLNALGTEVVADYLVDRFNETWPPPPP